MRSVDGAEFAGRVGGNDGLQRARLRLVGVRVEGLVPRESVHRQALLGERDHGWSDADRAVDRALWWMFTRFNHYGDDGRGVNVLCGRAFPEVAHVLGPGGRPL